ncbi:MAG TPA: hypothetical protein VF058_11185, partial [Actinomycetota bacterium]
MAQQGFDISRLTMGQKTLLITGLVFLVTLFFPWESFDVGGLPGFELPGVNISGWNGIGVLAGILAILLLVWELMLMAGVNLNLNVSEALISAGLAAATVLFGLIRFVIALTRSGYGIAWGAWVGLIVLLAMAYGAWVRFNESKAMGTPPPAPPAA